MWLHLLSAELGDATQKNFICKRLCLYEIAKRLFQTFLYRRFSLSYVSGHNIMQFIPDHTYFVYIFVIIHQKFVI